MYRVLVVEDEMLIRRGMIQSIRWQELDMVLAGEADNGRMALQFLDTEPVDIVITDMKMPVCDGREMLKEIEERGLECEILVLSEYSDFNYMRQAIHTRVVDYLLKPVEPNVLNELLQKARRRLAEKRLDGAHQSPLDRVFISAARKRIPDHYAEDCERYGFYFIQKKIYVTCIETKISLNQCPAVRQKLEKWVEEAPIATHVYLYREGGMIFCLLSEAPLQNSAGLEHRHHEWLRRLFQRCRSELNAEVRMGISKAAEEVCLLRDTIFASLLALQFLHNGRGDIVHYESVEKLATVTVGSAVSDRQLTELLSSEKDTREQITQIFLQPFLRQKYIYLPAVKKDLVDFTLTLERCNQKAGHAVNITSLLGENYIERISRFEWLSEIEDFLHTVLNGVFEWIASKRSLGTNGVVNEVLHTVQTRYMDDLSLLYFSKQYHFNYIYLSRMFKELTGVTFSDYLLSVRMKKAREFIEHDGLTEKETALMVGYSNPYYFISSYQKYFKFEKKERMAQHE